MKKIKFIAIMAILSVFLVGCDDSGKIDNNSVQQNSGSEVQNSESTGNNTANSTTISEEKAKEIALKHAGLSSNQVNFTKVEKDNDDGIEKYDIEFHSNNKEYDYEINATSGEIISYDIENYGAQGNSNSGNSSNTNSNANKNSAPKTTGISDAKAKEIALKHAGLSSNQVKFTKVEKDQDDGVTKYEVEFYYNNKEYNYEIDANNGKVLSYEVD